MNHNLPVILASSSTYRAALLGKLISEFATRSPNIDESKQPGETAEALCMRLAQEKALATARYHREALIIASDQVAVLGTTFLGKPGTPQNAFKQLKQCSGQKVVFLTSLCLYNSKTGHYQLDYEPVSVWFRTLSDEEIQAYIEAEQPLDCAGSFKVEGLGIALFERIEMSDPNTLVGLPLIKLTSMLRAEGVNPLLCQAAFSAASKGCSPQADSQ